MNRHKTAQRHNRVARRVQPVHPAPQQYEATLRALYDAIGNSLMHQPVGVPASVVSWMNSSLSEMTDNWEAIAPLLGIPPEHHGALGDALADRELMSTVYNTWIARKGYVVHVGAQVHYVLELGTRKVSSVVELPEKLRHPLGMLKLQDSGTYVRDCGYRHDDITFYIMEKNDE